MLLDDFRHHATQSPDHPAVICGERVCHYGELAAAAERYSAWFAERIATGDRVALLLDNSADYMACYYAAWACGAIAVGLNTALTPPEIRKLLQHCGAALVVVDASARKHRHTLAEAGIPVLVVGEPKQTEAHETQAGALAQAAAPRIEIDANQPASIIYTSGTTGDPKGVVLSHGNLAANVDAIRRYLEIRATDKAMCVLPFYYSYGNSVLHSHLASGACLVLENSLMYPHRVLEQMATHGTTAFYGVPSTYYLLLARTEPQAYDLAQLRYCAQAGGPMLPAKIEQWQSLLPGTDFVVMYGQTEASARLSWLPPERRRDKAGSVGIPIPGVELAIRDGKGRQQAPGEQGEVCARGANVMQGYWDNPAATDEVLREGWLYTGDLGYLDDDGYLFLVGRSREQIKTGAHRVSPREIEEAIAAVEGVIDVAVIGIDDDILGQSVKACIIADAGGSEALQKAVQRHCRQHLAAYKVPKTVAFYDEFPRTASGKIQKHRLQ